MVSRLARERQILDNILDVRARVFSFHNPGERTAMFRAADYAGIVNAAGAYFYGDVRFCSDLEGCWRGRRLEMC